jgi:hypothetical protein
VNERYNNYQLIVQGNYTMHTFLVKILESEQTSARKECNSWDASLCLDSSICIASISLGIDDTNALNSEITWFRPKSSKTIIIPYFNRCSM